MKRSKENAKSVRVSTVAAIGCRVHSGWAALVVVGASAKAPVVLERRRIIIADGAIAGSKQPYHYVETWSLPKAQEFLDRCMRRTLQMTREAFGAVLEEARAKGCGVIGCGILTASGRPVPSLEQALSSHTMLHTAEGEFYRNALVEASENFGVPVSRQKEKEIVLHATKTLGLTSAALTNRLTELGRHLGPPWSQDEKLAALMGWMVLAAAKRR